MNTVIKPGIGRVVLFYPNGYDESSNEQPFPAFVNYVHSNRLINVAGFNHGGTPFSRTSCILFQEGDEPPVGAHARWMPYQLGQAKKEGAKVSAGTDGDVLQSGTTELP